MQLQMAGNSAEKWSLVLARDARADGRFVYAVKSTGVFCRPSCPSRRPRFENVEFFDSPTQAQHAGYRPCRRCSPLARNAQVQKIEAACRYIDENLDVTLSLTAISRHVAISPFHFQRLFKRALGISPREYQQARRAGKFRQALLSQERVTDAIYEAGYSSSSRAYEGIPAQLGMTPSAFRKKGAGVEIRYTVLSTELGKLLIATTPRGLCSVRFGENDASLERELEKEFAAATIYRDDPGLKSLAAQISGLLGGTAAAPLPQLAQHRREAGAPAPLPQLAQHRRALGAPAPLPQLAQHRRALGAPAPEIALDIQGTAFQQLVWQALRRIPAGETRSYAEVASAIGRPRAVRAVANACASNPVAVVVPCHRVVQKNGSMAGYRWGVKRKKSLLEKEAAGR